MIGTGTIAAAGFVMLTITLSVFGQGAYLTTAETDKQKGWLEKRGINLETAYTGEFWANVRGGITKAQTSLHNVDISASLDAERMGFWDDGTFFFHVLSNQGTRLLTDEIVGDSQTVSNIEAPPSTRLYELWYEHLLFDGRLSLLLGIHDLNSEFAITEYGSFFINSSFGISKDISGGGRPGIFPLAAPAIRMKIVPDESWEFLLGVYNGDPGDPRVHRHFPRFVFDGQGGALIASEVGYHFSRKALPGTVRAGYWKNTGRFHDIFVMDSSGNPVSHRGNKGFYLIVDKRLFAGADNRDLGAFLQLGSAPDRDVNEFDWYAGGGLEYTGLIPGRRMDEAGIAIARAMLSDKLVDSLGRDTAETTLELTYRAVINKNIALQPDLQFVFNPGADSTMKNAVVAGARLEISF